MNPFSRRMASDIPMLDAATLEWLLSIPWESARPRVQCSAPPPNTSGAALPSTLNHQPSTESAEHPALSTLRSTLRPQMELRGNLAIIPIHGVLARRPDPFEQAFLGVEDSTAIYDLVTEAIANPEIRGILLHIDSPGGMHIGGPEIADAIWRSPKPVVAFADGQMASLAYFIGSQADEIVVTTSAAVGSIGSFMAVPDFSRLYEANGVKMNVVRNEAGKFKGIGIKGAAITDEQLGYLQDRAESAFRVFQKAVQRARPSVSEEAMQGQWYSGTEAKKLGLVDRLGDLPFALSVLRSQVRKS